MSSNNNSILYLILATAFLDLLGSSLFIPLFPEITKHFLQQESWTMWIQAIYSLGMFAAGSFMGNLSDKLGRKNTLMITTFVNIISYVLFYFALHTENNIATFGFGMYILARFVGGVGSSGFAVLQAFISDISTKENKTKNLGLMGAVFGSAFLVGPALGGILNESIGLDGIILLSLGLTILNFFWILFAIKEERKIPEKLNSEISKPKITFSNQIIFLLCVSLFVTIGFSVIQSGSAQFLTDKFSFTSQLISYSLVVAGITSILFQGFLINIVRKYFSENQMFLGGIGILMLSMLLYAINPFWQFVFVITVLFPIGFGMFNPVLATKLSSNATPETTGKIMGTNTSITGIGGIIGPVLVGFLYNFNITLPFWNAFVIFTILFGISYYFLEIRNKVGNIPEIKEV